MLSQPFIENAIEHGIMLKDEKGFIHIDISRQGDTIVIEIKDNGVGRKKASEMRKDSISRHKSLSTKITRERIDVYNSKAKNKIRLEISDILHPEKNTVDGTKVKLTIPVA
jgi:sensor histidine kinase YesM